MNLLLQARFLAMCAPGPGNAGGRGVDIRGVAVAIAVWENEQTIGSIRDILGVSQAQASEWTDVAEQAGWVERVKEDPAAYTRPTKTPSRHSRHTQVRLTPKGALRFNKLREQPPDEAPDGA
jgi:hypothetical protein